MLDQSQVLVGPLQDGVEDRTFVHLLRILCNISRFQHKQFPMAKKINRIPTLDCLYVPIQSDGEEMNTKNVGMTHDW